MESLNLTALAIEELNEVEMTDVNGGLAFIVAVLIGVAAGVVAGLLVNAN